MSVLRSIEQKIEGLFEGVFGRAFRTHVQPVELARKLVKEMEDHKVVSVSRVYVPNEYTVYLAPDDREQFTSYEASLQTELAEYLAENARREGYALLSPPRVLLESDADLAMGEFGIATRMVQPERRRREQDAPAGQVEPGATMIYRPKAPPPGRPRPRDAAELGVERDVAWLEVDGRAPRADPAPGRRSAARRTPTSRCRTRTSPAATRRSGRRARRTGSSTSTRRTGSR